jgi:hypothetical protein
MLNNQTTSETPLSGIGNAARLTAEFQIRPFTTAALQMPPSAQRSHSSDPSFGSWADMDKSAEDICSEMRAGRHFESRGFEL